MAIQEEMERALEGGDTGSALDTMRLMEQERSTVGEPVAAVAAREQSLRQRQPLQPWDEPQAAPTPTPQPEVEETEQVKIKLPTGEDVLVTVPVGLPDSEIVSRLKAAGELPPDPGAGGPEPERYRAGAALQGATMGTGDEWTAAITAAAVKAASWLPGEQAGEDSSYGDIYNDILESERSKLEEYREAYPVESTAYEVGGAMVPAIGSAGSAAPLTVGRAAAVGAGWGGLYGAGAATPDKELDTLQQVGERAKGAAVGATVGAATGAVLGTAAKGVGKIAERKLAKQMDTLEGKQKVLDKVKQDTMLRMAAGTPRIQAVQEAFKANNVPTKYARDLMIHNNGPIGWGKTAGEAMDEIVASVDVRRNSMIMGTIPIVDNLIRPIVSRINRWSPSLGQKVRNYEAKTHFDYHDWHLRAEPYAEGMRRAFGKTGSEERRELNRLLYNRKIPEARELIVQKGGEQLGKQFDEVMGTLDHIRRQMKRVGVKFDEVGGYFPRVPKDLDKLKEALGTETLEGIDVYMNKVGDPARALEMYMKANPRMKERALRSRKVREVTDNIDEYYYDHIASLDKHFRQATSLIRRRELLGKHAKVNEKGAEDINAGMESLVKDLLDIDSAAGRKEVADLLKIRFVDGERNMGEKMQALRNVGHMSLLGNIYAAATQLADVGPTMWVYGILNGLKGLPRSAAEQIAFRASGSGKGVMQFSADDLGIMRQMVQEINEQGAGISTKYLERSLKWSGFKEVDRLGKNNIINAAYSKATRMARSFHGKKQLAKDLKPAWGDETGQLIQELADGKPTELVRLYLFTQMSRMQPISKSEMPAQYNKFTDGRLFYQLMSWTIKQLDLLREETLPHVARMIEGDWLRTKPKEAAKVVERLSTLLVTVGLMGMGADETKRWLSGRDSSLKGVQRVESGMFDGMIKHTLKNFLGNDKMDQVISDRTQLQVPIADILAKLIQLGSKTLAAESPLEKREAEDELTGNLVNAVPIFGKPIYMWMMGGAEKFNERERERKKKEYMESMKH